MATETLGPREIPDFDSRVKNRALISRLRSRGSPAVGVGAHAEEVSLAALRGVDWPLRISLLTSDRSVRSQNSRSAPPFLSRAGRPVRSGYVCTSCLNLTVSRWATVRSETLSLSLRQWAMPIPGASRSVQTARFCWLYLIRRAGDRNSGGQRPSGKSNHVEPALGFESRVGRREGIIGARVGGFIHQVRRASRFRGERN